MSSLSQSPVQVSAIQAQISLKERLMLSQCTHYEHSFNEPSFASGWAKLSCGRVVERNRSQDDHAQPHKRRRLAPQAGMEGDKYLYTHQFGLNLSST